MPSQVGPGPIPTTSSGTVTSVSVTTANGVSGSVATATTTPAITLTLGAVTPSKVTITPGTDGAATAFIVNDTTATPRVVLGTLPGLTTYGGMWLGNVVPSASNYVLGASGGGDVALNAPSARNVFLLINDTTGVKLDSSGNLVTTGDNAHDLGASGATRFRTGYFGTSVVAPAVELASATVPITFTNAAFQGCTALGTSAGGVLTCTASDERLKDLMGPSGAGLGAILQITPRLFEWKDGRREGVQSGLIAQDVQRVLPLGVSENGEGYLQLQPDAITGALINAIKELHATVEDLRNQVAVLSGKKS